MCLRITDSNVRCPWEAIKARTHTHGHPLEQNALSWVKLNLDICEHGHETCSPNINTPLPLRTLHLKEVAQDMIEVTLFEDEAGVATGRYATLSHRWGDNLTCITTKSNIRDRRRRILWHTIPKTFQDAIIYCLKLGIEYLWIDTLCIMQDSPKDWQQQSAQMAGIYSNSYLTLSATAAIDSRVGCFSMSPSAPVQINSDLLGSAPPIYVREKLSHWTNPIRLNLKERLPLLTRAWVFQERILSTRTLHFCDRELVWECTETTICECDGIAANASIKQQFAKSPRYAKDKIYLDQARVRGNKETKSDPACSQVDARCMRNTDSMRKELLGVEGVESQTRCGDTRSKDAHPHNGFEDLVKAELKSSLSYRVRRNVRPECLPLEYPIDHELKQNIDEATHRKLIQGQAVQQFNGRDIGLWHRMVEQYSNLELTRASDRLPALSGLAERISPESRPYVAGLWKDTLRLDLLWRVNKLNAAHGRVPGNLGPTWSWSSVSSGVNYWTREHLKSHILSGPVRAHIKTLFGGIGSNLKEFKERTRLGWTGEDCGLDYNALTDPWLTDRAMLDWLSPELLDWCLLERSREAIPSIILEMRPIGVNPFGEVEKGILKVEGHLRKVRLQYVKDWGVKRGDEPVYDPVRYELDISTTFWDAMILAVTTRNVQWPFYADYNLSNPHPEHQVRNGAEVYLLGVLVNTSLVLRRTETGDYQRIGILQIVPGMHERNGMNLMESGQWGKWRLV
jgi:hypothetical protein